jgi:hypothetical protein
VFFFFSSFAKIPARRTKSTTSKANSITHYTDTHTHTHQSAQIMTDTIKEELSGMLINGSETTGEGSSSTSSSARVVSYYCEIVMQLNNNELEDLIVPFYYENVYPCSEDAAIGRDFVADALLTRAKRDFLPDASYCTNPQPVPWFGRVSSLPEDEIVTSTTSAATTDSSAASSGGSGGSSSGLSCSVLQTNEYNEQMQELIANGADPMQEVAECCVVVQGSMTFTKLALLEDESSMYQWVADQLNDNGSSTTEGSATLNINGGLAFPYRTHYLGAILEVPTSGEDNVPPPAINVNDGNNNSTTSDGSNNDGSNFTDVTAPTSNDNSNNNDGENNNNNYNNNGESSNNTSGNNPAPLPDASLTDKPQQPTTSNTGETNNNDAPKQFTWLGVLVAIGLVFVLVAVVYLICKRRRHLKKGLKVQAAVDSSEFAATSSPGSGRSLNKEQPPPPPPPVAMTKPSRTVGWRGRAAAARGRGAGGASAEATMSVEEEGDHDNEDLGNLHVTIVPTHTNSTHSGCMSQYHHPPARRRGSHDDEYDDENGGFVEMLSQDDDDDVESLGVKNDARHPPFQVSVLSDNPNMKIQAVATDSYHTSNHNQEEERDDDDDFFAARSVGGGGANSRRGRHHGGGATQTTGSTSSGTYQFDLADANRNAIMGTYNSASAGSSSGAAAVAGPITMTVVPPYSMEDDSDIDSWAQTEGTVGSLEDRYEETGEI